MYASVTTNPSSTHPSPSPPYPFLSFYTDFCRGGFLIFAHKYFLLLLKLSLGRDSSPIALKAPVVDVGTYGTTSLTTLVCERREDILYPTRDLKKSEFFGELSHHFSKESTICPTPRHFCVTCRVRWISYGCCPSYLFWQKK